MKSVRKGEQVKDGIRVEERQLCIFLANVFKVIFAESVRSSCFRDAVRVRHVCFKHHLISKFYINR